MEQPPRKQNYIMILIVGVVIVLVGIVTLRYLPVEKNTEKNITQKNGQSGLCIAFMGVQTTLDANVYSQNTEVSPFDSVDVTKNGKPNMIVFRIADMKKALTEYGLTEPNFYTKTSNWPVYERKNQFTGTIQFLVDAPTGFRLGILDTGDPNVEDTMRELINSAYVSDNCTIQPLSIESKETGNTLCFEPLLVQTDLSLENYSYITPPNVSVIIKNDQPYIIIYPLIPGFDVKSEYGLSSSYFTVKEAGWTVYKNRNDSNYIVDSFYLPFIIFPAMKDVGNDVYSDIEKFLKSARLTPSCPSNSGKREPSDIEEFSKYLVPDTQ